MIAGQSTQKLDIWFARTLPELVAGIGGASISSTCGGANKDLLVLVLEGKVEGLGGEIADDVCGVATPESGKALLLVHTASMWLESIVFMYTFKVW
jgi:hypothetical protein